MKTILLVLLFTSIVTEARWPIFIIPPPDKLITSGVIDLCSCPTGYGKVHKNTTFLVNQFTQGFCPNNWYWKILNDTDCFDLSTLQYINHQIELDSAVRETGLSTITAEYVASKFSSFTIRFKTPPQGWQCYNIDAQQRRIICANDS